MPTYTLTINNVKRTVSVDSDTPLLWVLRDNLELTGTKFGCGAGVCGACTVLFNDKAVRSCTVPVASVTNGKIITIEGISSEANHAVQQAWIELDVPQCGYCQSGQIMSAIDLLSRNEAPNEDDINSAMVGNICRCGSYTAIRKAIRLAATKSGK